MCVELKIKTKHLAYEPAIIQKEIRKLGKQLEYSLRQSEKWDKKSGELNHKIASLHEHKDMVVAVEARATYLARAFLAGRDYNSVERHRKPVKEAMFRRYVVPRVLKIVAKYKPWGKVIPESDVKAWLGM